MGAEEGINAAISEKEAAARAAASTVLPPIIVFKTCIES